MWVERTWKIRRKPSVKQPKITEQINTVENTARNLRNSRVKNTEEIKSFGGLEGKQLWSCQGKCRLCIVGDAKEETLKQSKRTAVWTNNSGSFPESPYQTAHHAPGRIAKRHTLVKAEHKGRSLVHPGNWQRENTKWSQRFHQEWGNMKTVKKASANSGHIQPLW